SVPHLLSRHHHTPTAATSPPSLHDALPICVWLSAEQYATIAGERSIRCAVLAEPRVGNLAAESARHHLEAVTDAERRHTEVEDRSEEHTSELQSRENLVCRLLLEKKKKDNK